MISRTLYPTNPGVARLPTTYMHVQWPPRACGSEQPAILTPWLADYDVAKFKVRIYDSKKVMDLGTRVNSAKQFMVICVRRET